MGVSDISLHGNHSFAGKVGVIDCSFDTPLSYSNCYLVEVRVDLAVVLRTCQLS